MDLHHLLLAGLPAHSALPQGRNAPCEPIESALPWIANLMHTSRMWQVGQRRLCSDEHPLCRDSRHKTCRLGSDEGPATVVMGSSEGRSPAATDRGTAEGLQPAKPAAAPTSVVTVTVIFAAARPAGARPAQPRPAQPRPAQPRPAEPQRSGPRVAAAIAESAQAGLEPQPERAGLGPQRVRAGLGPQWVRAGLGLNPSPHRARPPVAPAA